MAFLELEALSRRYGETLAVDGFSLAVEQGEFVALLGPSGCGKTTTLQMIAGFVEPSAGRIRLDGTDITGTPPSARNLGLVFQNYALFPHMTVAGNVAFGLEMRRVAPDERRRRVAETLELVGLGAFADRYPARLSGGQQQRVALARALVIRPPLLLLDEPLSNLDAKLREEMQVELRVIQRTVGTTTLLVTHDQAEALALSDRIVVMNAGRIEQIGAPLTAYESPRTEFVSGFLGRANRLDVEAGEPGSWRIGGGNVGPAPGADPGYRGPVIVRPEKIRFAAAGSGILRGTVDHRVFQGNHWLYQVGTPAGRVLVIRQNDGGATPAEGDAVALEWRPEDMRVVGLAM